MANYSASILTAYHGETGTVIHINDIDEHTTGQKLGSTLVCMDCGAQVQARIERNNPKRKRAHSRHFAHVSSNTACIHQGETYLHLKAKEIIKDAMCMNVPPLAYTSNLPNGEHYYTNDEAMRLFRYRPVGLGHFDIVQVVQNPTQMKFSNVALEYHTDAHSFIPDCYATTTDGQKVYIEIYVTHAVEEEKRVLLAEQGISTLEIDLSDPMYRQIDSPEWGTWIKQVVIGQIKQKEWLFHADTPRAIDQLRQLYLSRIHANNCGVIDKMHKKALVLNTHYSRVIKHLNVLKELITEATVSLNYAPCVRIQSLLDKGLSGMTYVDSELRHFYDNRRQMYREQLVNIEYDIIQKYLLDVKNGNKPTFTEYTTQQLNIFKNDTLDRFRYSSDMFSMSDIERMYESLSVEIYERNNPSGINVSPELQGERNDKSTKPQCMDPTIEAEQQRETYEKQTSDLLKSYGIDDNMSW